MDVSDAMRKLWEKFGPSMTKSVIYVDGVKREMTEREKQLFDESFSIMDNAFDRMNATFDEARTENRRRTSPPTKDSF